jgi:hypothetical protein
MEADGSNESREADGSREKVRAKERGCRKTARASIHLE